MQCHFLRRIVSELIIPLLSMISRCFVVNLILCLGSCFLGIWAEIVANIPSSEYSALHDFYIATNGPAWNWTVNVNIGKVHWDFSNPDANPCIDDWIGILCFESPIQSHVTNLILSEVNLEGYLPSSISNLTYLTKIVASNNYLQSSLPSSLFSMTNLTQLYLSNNNLTGTISPAIGSLYNLYALSLSINRFHGPIPDELFNLTGMFFLGLDRNDFTGTITSKVAMMAELSNFDVSHNKLHGEVPSSLFCLPYIGTMSLNANGFTGPLPDCGIALPQLAFLLMGDNHFSSTIPESYGLFTGLLVIDISSNKLEGTLPDFFGNLLSVYSFTIDDNLLTGPFPSSLARLNLSDVIMDSNYFSGPIPEELWNSMMLAEVRLSHNLFSGSISDNIGAWGWNYGSLVSKSITTLEFDYNTLTGTLPRSISRLQYLESIFVDNNRFSGNLDGVFNASLMTMLINIDVSTNQLTGTLPEELFKVGLYSLAAGSNCFRGSLPSNICQATALRTLALDSMISATSCQNRFFPRWSHINSYWTPRKIEGSIPSCLLDSMPDLIALHLNGNGFGGSIPQIQSISPNLSDLSLSNNLLQGRIPSVIQTRVWKEKLDLSYNLLGGELTRHFPPVDADASLYLEVNRLSGVIPTNLKDAQHIAILDSNLFSCSGSRDTLPTHDPDNAQYECGSNSLNAVLYVGLTIGIILLVCAVAMWSCVHNRFRRIKTLMAQYLEAFRGSVRDFSFLAHLRSCCNMLALVIFVTMMIVNTVLSTHFNTYTHEYAWNISSVFLSGWLPAVVLLLAFGGLGLIEWRVFLKYLNLPTLDQSYSSKGPKISWNWTQRLILGVTVIGNVILMVAVNIAYVFVNKNYSSDAVQTTQLAVAIFKVCWNGFLVRFVLRLTRNFNEESSKEEDATQGSLVTALSLMLFNNLAAPFLAIALISSSCFYDVITTPATVDTPYSYYFCGNYAYDQNFQIVCTEMFRSFELRTISYIPPFHYGYQCSSTYISVYSSIYVIMLIISTFVTPLLQSTLVCCERYTSKDGALNTLLNVMLMPILRANRFSSGQTNPVLNFLSGGVLFNVEMFIVQLINIVAVMLTFGVVFPPIALFCGAAVFSMSWFAQLCIGRCIVMSRTFAVGEDIKENLLGSEPAENNVMFSELSQSRLLFLQSLWIAVPFCVVFYSFLLFDTLGDSKGWKVATAMPAVVAGVVMVVGLLLLLRKRWSNDRDSLKFTGSREPSNDARLTLDFEG